MHSPHGSETLRIKREFSTFNIRWQLTEAVNDHVWTLVLIQDPWGIPDESQTKTTANSKVVLMVFLQEEKRIQFILLKLALVLITRLAEQNGTR